jgi:hypothetical protein
LPGSGAVCSRSGEFTSPRGGVKPPLHQTVPPPGCRATSLLQQLGVNSNHAPVAQMDRAAAFEAEGRGFESLQARQFLCAFEVANLRVLLRYLASLRMTEHNGSQDCVRAEHRHSRPRRSRRGADHASKGASALTMPRPGDERQSSRFRDSSGGAAQQTRALHCGCTLAHVVGFEAAIASRRVYGAIRTPTRQ